MSFNFKSIFRIGVIFTALLLTACGDAREDSAGAVPESTPKSIKVGLVASNEYEVAEVAKKVAKDKYNLNVELVTFMDYSTLNKALNSGDINANAFQHKPYLNKDMQDNGYRLVAVGKTFIYPLAAYSKKIKSLDDLQPGMQIVIPNDPSNRGRALLLLQANNLITLKPSAGLMPNLSDILENLKGLQLTELDAAHLTGALDDPQVAMAIINNTYSAAIGLTAVKDGIISEESNSAYVNWIVAREDNKDAENVKLFVKAYQSDEVATAAERLFGGSAVKGW